MSEVTTLVGTGDAGCGADGRIEATTPIAEPFDVAVGPDGALYFCDLGNHVVRRVDLSTRTMTTVTGNTEKGYSGDGGLATDASMMEPYEIRFDAAGNLFVVDMPAHVVRRVDRATGVIETIAGTGEKGFSGDGGLAVEAAFSQPHSIELVSENRMLVADIGNHRIRCVDLDTGRIDTFAGTGSQAPTVDDGLIGIVDLNGPRTLALDEQGDVFLTLREGNAVYRIDMHAGTIHHVAGTGEFGYSGDGGDAASAKLAGPKGIAVDREAVYIADTESHTVRRIDRRDGSIVTVLGDGSAHDGPDGDPLRCGLARPHGVCVHDGQIFVGDSDNHRVRRLTLD